MRGFRSEARRTNPPVKMRCRVLTKEKGRCKRWGYGGYCHAHTPPEGAGVATCYICGLPTALHGFGDWCVG